MDWILEQIGEPAVLEQLAEECNELAHAALKLARVLRQENPTPVTQEEARANLSEEAGDVLNVALKLFVHKRFTLDVDRCNQKMDRWEQRIREKQGEMKHE